MIFQPAYFFNIGTFQEIIKNEVIYLEVNDFFEKQTFRTRCNIYAANGLLSMNIPIKHHKIDRQLTKNVKLENDFNWQKNHFKTIQNSYRSSPYFEFYEDEMAHIYSKKEEFLIDFLLNSFDLSIKLLQLKVKYTLSAEYLKEYPSNDFRYLVDAKKQTSPKEHKEYIQVFNTRHGFIPNLSILDLLFNEGPNAINFLK